MTKPVPATPAPSQPAGAREAAKALFDVLDQYIIEFNTIEPQMNEAAIPVICAAMETYAAQQTAAKDVALWDRCIEEVEAQAMYWNEGSSAKEALRDLAITFKALKAEKEGQQ